jgi:gluconate 2-dehydrogenase gamma chain
MNKVTRRSFVTATAAATLVPASALLGKPAAKPPGMTGAMHRKVPANPGYLFFDAAEAQFVEAACERLIPADESGPGALDAGVPGYLDLQLGGSWGAGERVYRSEPWQPGTPSPGIQLPFAPAELFRKALRAINLDFEKRATSFTELPCHAQDAFLATLESGEATPAVPAAAVFFDMLLKMTVEGFFSHPIYGRTRDRVAWRMSGFPGAYAAAS